MKVTINLTLDEKKHLASPHTFYDSCKQADDVLRKVQKEIDKKYTPPKEKPNKEELKWIKMMKEAGE